MATKKVTRVTSVLLCWLVMPEDYEFYRIPRRVISGEEMAMLRACHGRFVNAVREKGDDGDLSAEDIDRYLVMLSDKLVNPQADWIDDQYLESQSKAWRISPKELREKIGTWHQYKIDMDKPKNFKAVKVIVSGFLL